MHAVTPSILLEQSFQIAWDYLDRTGQTSGRDTEIKFVSNAIIQMMSEGTTNKIVLANRAIAKFERVYGRGQLVA